MTTAPRPSRTPRTDRTPRTRRPASRRQDARRSALWKWAHAGDEQAVFEHRVSIVGALVAVALVVSGAVLANRQMFTADAFASEATDERTVHRSLPAVRGSITDTNGKILAKSVQRYTIYADQKAAARFEPVACTVETKDYCHQIEGKKVTGKGPAAVARILAPVLSMSVSDLTKKLTGRLRYTVLKKDVSPTLKRSIDNLHLSSVIGAQLTTTRSYPAGSVLGTVLGAVDSKDEGVAGLELTENKTLSGQDGEETYQRGASGEEIPGTRVVSRQPVNGSSVRLTIDSDVQWYAQRALENTMLKNPADWGVAVVQEVKTGRILAIADTGNVKAGSTEAALKGSRAVSSSIEPGSIGKLVTLCAELEKGVHQPTDRFTVPYSITKDGQTYHDALSHGNDRLTLAGILAHSSNVGTIESSTQIDDTTLYNYLRAFGIGQPTGLNLAGESAGLLRQPSQWDGRTSQTVRFGQGYAANALQIANLAAIIGNGGVKVQQRLVDSVTDTQGRTQTQATGSSKRVISQKTASEMINMMEDVVEYERYDRYVPNHRLAGKSGTAQVADSKGNLTNVYSDFVMLAPAESPKYSIFVGFMNPQAYNPGVTNADIANFLLNRDQAAASPARTDAYPTTW